MKKLMAVFLFLFLVTMDIKGWLIIICIFCIGFIYVYITDYRNDDVQKNLSGYRLARKLYICKRDYTKLEEKKELKELCNKCNIENYENNQSCFYNLLTLLYKYENLYNEAILILLALKEKSDSYLLNLKHNGKSKAENIKWLKENYNILLALKTLEQNLYNKTRKNVTINFKQTEEFFALKNELNRISIFTTVFEADNVEIVENNIINIEGDFILCNGDSCNKVVAIFPGIIFEINKYDKKIVSFLPIDSVKTHIKYVEENITFRDRNLEDVCLYGTNINKTSLNKFQLIKKGETHYYYLHERINGEPDRRYNDNPLMWYRTDTIGVYMLVIDFSEGVIKIPLPTKEDCLSIRKLFNRLKRKCRNMDFVSFDQGWTIQQIPKDK